MERLGKVPPGIDGELFGESYTGVTITNDVKVLWRNAIAFVGNPDISRTDFFRTLADPFGVLEDGTFFERSFDPSKGDIINFINGERNATIILNLDQGIACVFKRQTAESSIS